MRIGTVQAVAEAKFITESNCPGLCGKESVRTTFDDEISIVERDSVCGNFATQTTIGFKKCNL